MREAIQKIAQDIETLIAEKDREILRLKRELDEQGRKSAEFQIQTIRLESEKQAEAERKIALINTLNFIESEGAGGELFYVYAEKTSESVETLLRIGVPPEEIEEMTADGGKLIDVSGFGFTYAAAKWFDGDRFLPVVPEDAPEWCK